MPTAVEGFRADGAKLVIIGASTRAAAQSALRAGLAPVCGDLFADWDLARACPVRVLVDYPNSALDLIRELRPAAWMYAGGIENRPAIVDEGARLAPLAGNSGAVVREVRSPVRIQECLRDCGLPALAVSLSSSGLPRDGSWLRKPIFSCGGSRVAPWTGQDSIHQLTRKGWYFQQFKAGRSCGAVFLAAGITSLLVGVTEQLLGDPCNATRPFRYRGSAGPLRLEMATVDALEELGRALARRYGLRGLFGIDMILAEGRPWLVEVNPRYTASCEILERALAGVSLVELHLRACFDGTLPDKRQLLDARSPPHSAMHYAKEVWFASEQLVITSRLAERLRAEALTSPPTAADVPREGIVVPTGGPIATAFAAAPSLDGARAELGRRLATWRAIAASQSD